MRANMLVIARRSRPAGSKSLLCSQEQETVSAAVVQKKMGLCKQRSASCYLYTQFSHPSAHRLRHCLSAEATLSSLIPAPIISVQAFTSLATGPMVQKDPLTEARWLCRYVRYTWRIIPLQHRNKVDHYILHILSRDFCITKRFSCFQRIQCCKSCVNITHISGDIQY